MKILYDYQIFTDQNYGGISRYFAEIINLLKNDSNNDFEISNFISNNYYLKQYTLNRYSFLPNIDFTGKRKIMKLTNRAYTHYLLKKNDFDIFHPTYYNPYFLNLLSTKPYIITVYDLIYELYKENNLHHEKLRNDMKETISKASHIISISENTKKDIMHYYNIESDKITTVYLGNSLIVNEQNNSTLKIPEDYFLFVGKRNGYKNFQNLAIGISRELLKKKIYLICAGGDFQSLEEYKLLKELKIDNNVLFYPRISDHDLVHLYKNARAFIFPSKYEGFGIPVLESFACGCPVLVSNSSSLPEVGGSAAIYFDPNSIESIADSVNNFLHSNTIKLELVSKGYQQLSKFSWKNTYLNTLEVYKRVI